MSETCDNDTLQLTGYQTTGILKQQSYVFYNNLVTNTTC